MSIRIHSFTKPTVRDMQHFRQQYKFPKDRIAFRKEAYQEDMKVLKLWKQGKINTEALCVEIAWNNYLNEYFPNGAIPMDMMIKFLEDTGWLPKSKK